MPPTRWTHQRGGLMEGMTPAGERAASTRPRVPSPADAASAWTEGARGPLRHAGGPSRAMPRDGARG
eukprot:4899544-Alexandrium_andersonii.AAC.1